jgi:cyclopropane fatty-acyl-phospholipid synthase-like methyltransferase
MNALEIVLRGIHRVRRTLDRGQGRHGEVGAVFQWEKKRQFQLQFLRQMGLLPQHRILDIGCGTLRGGLPLIDYLEAGNYHGVDVREHVLNEGRQELVESGLEWKSPTLHHTPSLQSFTLTQTFDFVWGFSVLIHMPDIEVSNCFGLVANVLAPSGHFFANVRLGSTKDERGRWKGQFPIVQRPLSFYETEASRRGLLVEDLGTLWALGHRTFTHGDLNHMLRIRHS